MTKRRDELSLKLGEALGKEKTCTNKFYHSSRRKAWRIALAINSKPNRRHKVHVYPCFWCNGWHVGQKIPIEEIERLIKRIRRSKKDS